MTTYSDEICDWLVEQGYTHCFFVAGGNIMHLLNSARTRFKCIPVVHEVTAGIAAEYFNELNFTSEAKAFALVTAGPGLTNIVTAIAGAQIESRELLVIGGQVKSSDLSNNLVRQRGIQEINGVDLVKSICKSATSITKPISKKEFLTNVSLTHSGRKGVVFLEICLDVQGQNVDVPTAPSNEFLHAESLPIASDDDFSHTIKMLETATRPLILIGGGVNRVEFSQLYLNLIKLGIPLMTTWNGADRVPHEEELNWGRPNTWGMRYSNVLIQQSDLVLAVGTRLGLQQTGFNWQEFAPLAKVIQVDIDQAELTKGHPTLHLGVLGDANEFLHRLTVSVDSSKISINPWLELGLTVKRGIPLSDPQNNTFIGYWNPYEFMRLISSELTPGDVLVPSSSGAAETVAMQSAEIPSGAFVVTDKGMASMGYGLGGAIGAAFKTGSRVFHIEGDGGFAQNLQELGTVSVNNLPLKIFIFDNGGYASIRMTQKSYFEGQILGCDIDSGLGLPNWEKLFSAFGISCQRLEQTEVFSDGFLNLIRDDKPHAFLVPIHPEQSYFPKITSRILPSGEMTSNPLHSMTPNLSAEEIERFLPHLKDRILM
jgi:acetolactate synthase I/II/III large subunit